MSQLATFNRALELLGESPLENLAEADDREAGRILTTIWEDGAVKACLEQGQWNFSIRSQQLGYNPSITSEFGYLYAFDTPEDFVRWAAVCLDPYYETPLLRYTYENGRLFCDHQDIYVRYVSMGDDYGAAYSLWPESFKMYIASYLAARAAFPLGKNEGMRQRALDYMSNCKYDAKNKDVLQEPTRQRVPGSVIRARRGRHWSE